MAIGAATGHVGEGAMLGAALGGMGGAMAGSAAENYTRKKAGKDLLKGVRQDLSTGGTALRTGAPPQDELAGKSRMIATRRRVWVEEKVVDGKVMDAHYEERMMPSGRWGEDDEKTPPVRNP